jgi:hypothetical protein
MNKYANIPPRPMRSQTKSQDDLAAVSAMDAAEARLRAAKMLADEESKRAEEEERKSLELQRANLALQTELATLRATQSVAIVPAPAVPVVAATSTDGKPLSISPQGVTVRGSHWKFTIPITLIVSLVPLIFTLVNDYTQMKRDFKAQTDTYARVSARIEEINTYAHEVGRSNEELREKVAELSGYLAGVLPKAGVKVPGAEPGAIPVNVVSDPLPLGEMKKRGKPIIVRTPVPAPAPKDTIK